MLNTQWGTLIENVSKEVMAFIDLPKKNSSDGSKSNLFGILFELGYPAIAPGFKRLLCFVGAKSPRKKFTIKLEKAEFVHIQSSNQLAGFWF